MISKKPDEHKVPVIREGGRKSGKGRKGGKRERGGGGGEGRELRHWHFPVKNCE